MTEHQTCVCTYTRTGSCDVAAAAAAPAAATMSQKARRNPARHRLVICLSRIPLVAPHITYTLYKVYVEHAHGTASKRIAIFPTRFMPCVCVCVCNSVQSFVPHLRLPCVCVCCCRFLWLPGTADKSRGARSKPGLKFSLTQNIAGRA